jgi:hypothetical protein
MSTRQRKIARGVLCLVALLSVVGCSSARNNRVSEKSWNQTAAKEEREQQRNAAPQGDWEVLR